METFPKNILDTTLWPLIHTLWEPFSRKNSHFWQWITYPNNLVHSLPIVGREGSGSRHKSQLHNLIQTNFLWDQTIIIKPKNYNGKYRLGFEAQEGNIIKRQICTVLLQGETAALLSPYGFNLFAESYPQRNQIELQVVITAHKQNLPKTMILV